MRTHEQTMEALERANHCRRFRAQVKRWVARGEISPLVVLQDPGELMEGLRVREFLICVPGLGPVKVDQALDHCRISSKRTIGQLTERQVWQLDERLSAIGAWCAAISENGTFSPASA